MYLVLCCFNGLLAFGPDWTPYGGSSGLMASHSDRYREPVGVRLVPFAGDWICLRVFCRGAILAPDGRVFGIACLL